MQHAVEPKKPGEKKVSFDAGFFETQETWKKKSCAMQSVMKPKKPGTKTFGYDAGRCETKETLYCRTLLNPRNLEKQVSCDAGLYETNWKTSLHAVEPKKPGERNKQHVSCDARLCETKETWKKKSCVMQSVVKPKKPGTKKFGMMRDASKPKKP
ncbi:hypothetical protein BaRGS_00031018 [Batillaria attramentaria]|uniref:Uncharacterized protein n=1 Tax=Batillaria attramentaria TaxID=370345 RepID=A0ABD0JSX1_9CAEN